MRFPFGFCGRSRLLRRDEWLRTPTFARRDLVHRSARGDRGILVQNPVLFSFARELIAMLDQKPIYPLFAFSLAHPGQNPAAVKFLTLQGEVQLAFPICALSILAIPMAAIPDHYGATAVLAFWDRAFKVTVIQRMVFDLDREALVVGVEGRALGDGPGFEDPVKFEPQVVMQVRCRMLLNDEAEALRSLDLRVPAGLGRF